MKGKIVMETIVPKSNCYKINSVLRASGAKAIISNIQLDFMLTLGANLAPFTILENFCLMTKFKRTGELTKMKLLLSDHSSLVDFPCCQ